MKKRTPHLLLLLLLLCSKTAFSQGTFTAIANNSWTNTLSWSHTGTDGDNIPDADDIVTIPNGRTISMPAGTQQVASLTIQNGGTLNMNTSGAILTIFPSGGLLQVDLGGTIQDGNTNTEINFLNTSSFVMNGIIQADFLQFQGTGQTVTITGGGTLLVGRINVSAINVTVNLNTSGSFGSNVSPLTAGQANFTLNGTGTINIGGGQNFNISASGVSVGCTMTCSDIAAIANSGSLTITNGGNITVGDDLRIGPNASSDNFTLTVNSGGTLSISSDVLFNDAGTGSGDNFTFNNSGTVSITGLINFNNETLSNINNYNSFNLDGSITNSPAANPNELLNDVNATLTIAGNIDTDVTTTFTANGNTVNYDGAAQNIRATTYHNLTLSGSAAKTALGNIVLRGNWTRSGTATFTPGANTVTFSALAGTAAQTIAAVGGETFNNLTINSAFASIPQIILSNPVTVTSTLNLQSGVINLNSNQLTLGASGTASVLIRTASTTTNWVYGGAFRRFWPITQTPSPTAGNLYGLFPLGHSTASSYRPVAITAGSNVTTTGSVTFTHVNTTGVTDVTAFDDDPGAPVVNIVRKHNSQFIGAVSGVAGGTNYTISVTMTGLPSGTASDIRLAVSNGASTVTNVGTHIANSGTAQSPIVGRSGINAVASLANDFRITTINTTNTPLPIELVSFKGEIVRDGVQLNWETASEMNNDFFTVERSDSGEAFSSIGEVSGAGTTSHGNTYSLVDYNPIIGTSYYRIKQTDFDGTSTYSKIIDIAYEGPKIPFMDVFPNPTAGDEINIKISGLKNTETVPVVIYDQLGKECMRLLLSVDQYSGTAFTKFSPEKVLSHGMYLIKAGHSPSLTVRFVVAK